MAEKKPTPHYYRILGLTTGIDYGLSYIVLSFVKTLKAEAKMIRIYQGEYLDDCKRRIYDLCEAVRICTSPGKSAQYLEMGHDAWMVRHPVSAPMVGLVALMDWLELALEEVKIVADDARSGCNDASHAMFTESYTDILKLFPGHIRGDRISLGASEIAEALLSYVDPDEKHHRDRYGLEDIRPERVRWVWQTIHSEKNGRAILGSCKALGKRDRLLQKRADPYLWEITLSLDYWLVADKKERQRLVHHELAHCRLDTDADGNPAPKVKGHSIEEMLSTMLYFGPLDRTQSAVIDAGKLHPAIGEAGPGPLFARAAQ